MNSVTTGKVAYLNNEYGAKNPTLMALRLVWKQNSKSGWSIIMATN